MPVCRGHLYRMPTPCPEDANLLRIACHCVTTAEANEIVSLYLIYVRQELLMPQGNEMRS